MRGKVLPSHLERRAFVYVRQSTTMQVHEHVESKQRQYALADRAVALGWDSGSVEVIDEDQGKSGATTEGRTGFGRLADAVAHGEAGAILAIEISRLARSSTDWQHLLQVCAVADVLVIDDQTIYDPSDRDDKLLLDLKGTMSEAELHWLRLRLVGGRMNKARRGELEVRPPTGYLWQERRFILDPDEAVQHAIRVAFERFAIEPTAWAVVRWANETGFKLPSRRWHPDGSSEIEWRGVTMGRLGALLHNPTYAGVYSYGRRRQCRLLVDGQVRRRHVRLSDPRDWPVRLEGMHPAYIDWETFVKNQEKLRENQSKPQSSTRGAPNRGIALLAGLLLCGRCGRRMRTQYGGRRTPQYYCTGLHDKALSICWSAPARRIDDAVEELFLRTMVPAEIDLSLAVEHEAKEQAEALEKQWRARLEQAGYEARRAERRYKAVDPDNRVVARTLEREWEERLRDLAEVERQYADARRARHVDLSDADRDQIRALARDLPKVWRAPTTRLEERKAMLRLVVEAITLCPIDVPRRATQIRVQWKSGAIDELLVDRPYRHQSRREAVERLQQLVREGLTDAEITRTLNNDGHQTGQFKKWTSINVQRARRKLGLEANRPPARSGQILPDRHPKTGAYSVPGTAARFGVSIGVVKGWLKTGLVRFHHERYGRYNARWLEIDVATAELLSRTVASGTKTREP